MPRHVAVSNFSCSSFFGGLDTLYNGCITLFSFFFFHVKMKTSLWIGSKFYLVLYGRGLGANGLQADTIHPQCMAGYEMAKMSSTSSPSSFLSAGIVGQLTWFWAARSHNTPITNRQLNAESHQPTSPALYRVAKHEESWEEQLLLVVSHLKKNESCFSLDQASQNLDQAGAMKETPKEKMHWPDNSHNLKSVADVHMLPQFNKMWETSPRKRTSWYGFCNWRKQRPSRNASRMKRM